MRLSEAPLNMPSASPRTRAFIRRLGAVACSAKIVVLVLVSIAASLVASASAVHAASARPVKPDVGMYGDPVAAKKAHSLSQEPRAYKQRARKF